MKGVKETVYWLKLSREGIRCDSEHEQKFKVIHSVVLCRDWLINNVKPLRQNTTEAFYCSYVFRTCKVIIRLTFNDT